MYLTTICDGDEFVLTDKQGKTVGSIVLRRRKGQRQIGVEIEGLTITKQQPQHEVNNERISKALG